MYVKCTKCGYVKKIVSLFAENVKITGHIEKVRKGDKFITHCGRPMHVINKAEYLRCKK